MGDLLHLVQIGVLLISIGIVYEKFDQNQKVTSTHTDQLNRIEHYLSSQDAHYWDKSRQSE